MKTTFPLMIGLMAVAVLFEGCAGEAAVPVNTSSTVTNVEPKTPAVDADPAGEFMRSESGTPAAEPASGRTNIQGKVFYNLRPVAGIEVRLCVSPNMFGDCVGEKHTAKTDENGQYLFADIEPMVYGGIFVRVPDSKDFIFSSGSGIGPKKLRAEAGKTFFVPLTTLFKTDLKVLDPKPKSTVDAQNLDIRWEPYPDAAYYTVDLMSFSDRTHQVANQRTTASDYKPDNPISNGTYRLRVEAFNSANIKLSQSAHGIEFTLTGGPPAAEPTPAPTEKPPFMQ